jgi:hypothetical protein
MLDVQDTPSGTRDVSMAQQKRHVSMRLGAVDRKSATQKRAINAVDQLPFSMSIDTKKSPAVVADPMLCTRSPTMLWLLHARVKSAFQGVTASRSYTQARTFGQRE